MVFGEMSTYIAIFSIVVVSLWSIVGYPKRYIFKIVFIPFLFFVMLSLFQTYQSILGYATTDIPEKTLQYLYYIKMDESLFVIMLGDRGEPRMYKLPYSDELEKELRKMEEKSSRGIMTFGTFKKNALGNSDESNPGDFILLDTPFQKIVPKEEN